MRKRQWYGISARHLEDGTVLLGNWIKERNRAKKLKGDMEVADG